MVQTLLRLVLGLALLTPVGPPLATAQTGDDQKILQKEMETLKEGQSAIHRQLQELQNLLRGARPALLAPHAQTSVIKFDGAPVKGDKDAKLTLVEFSDYQCPFCTRHATNTFPDIDKAYVATGKVKYVFRDFPIEAAHPQAFKAHEAAHCAGEQGKYWEMHSRLFATSALGPSDLSGHAKALGLDVAGFEQCLSSGKHATKIQQSLLEGQQAGVRGTPTFFVGLTSGHEASISTPQMIIGAQPYATFKQVLDAVLTGAK